MKNYIFLNYVLDFGLSKKYTTVGNTDRPREHIENKPKRNQFLGTKRYASQFVIGGRVRTKTIGRILIG